MKPADAVIFILVDALRHDYVERTRFLQRLAGRSLAGALEEPFGFMPRGAYFGGLTMAEQGFTHLFRCDPHASVFRLARVLSDGDERLGDWYRDALVTQARAALPPFAAAYADPIEIPLSRLASFDIAEREAPWSPHAGYESLFHLLDAARVPWLEVSWPFDGISWPDSGKVTGVALGRWRPEHRFVFIHLPDLDAYGHKFGPGSVELQRVLLETDSLCERLVEHASEVYRDPVIVLAGDHGMLPVVRTVDVESPLSATGLRWGHDIAYFIDSTMVRCWTTTAAARARAIDALGTAGGGHVLTAAEERRFELFGIDRRNGEIVFLADPGVLFSPSYFDWTGTHPPAGMHGYAPDAADNRGALIVSRPARRERGSLGVVAARRLFPSFLQWLGLRSARVDLPSPIAPEPPAFKARWSRAGTAQSDALVDRHLARLDAAISERAPDHEAVILAGSFGRGEGTLTGSGEALRPANDYDVIVVGGQPDRLEGLGPELAREFGIDFVDITVVDTLARSEPLSQFDYDLRYGSRTIAGSPLALDALPRYAPAEIGLLDGLVHIGNRAGGLLLGLTGQIEAADSHDLCLARQTTKLLIAIADCWLIAQHDYHPSYAVRRARFASLAPAVGFASSVVATIDAAFAARLGDGAPQLVAPETHVRIALAALSALEGALGSGRGGAVEVEVAAAVAGRVTGSIEWLRRAALLGLRPSADTEGEPTRGVPAVYGACFAALRAWDRGEQYRETRVKRALAPCFEYDGARAGAAPAVASAWFNLFH